MSQYFTILTTIGAAALANATALGQSIKITQFAVGDGGSAAYNPDLATLKASSTLVNELYRGAVNQLSVNPDNPASYYIEGVVPVEIGGWTAREVGWFLSDGRLFAVTKLPPSYKTVPADGAATELPIRTYLAIGSDANVTLKVDPTVVLATRGYVTDALKKATVKASQAAVLNADHLYLAHADVQLDAVADGFRTSFKVDRSVDLKVGKCRLLAPIGETIDTENGNFEAVNFVVNRTTFEFVRADGQWRQE